MAPTRFGSGQLMRERGGETFCDTPLVSVALPLDPLGGKVALPHRQAPDTAKP